MTIKPKTFFILLAILVIYLLEFAPVPTTSDNSIVTRADGSNTRLTNEEAARLDQAAYDLTHQKENDNAAEKN